MKKYKVNPENLDLFLLVNEQLRQATAHAETQFFSQFKDISILQAHIILSINFNKPCKMSEIAKNANLSLGGMTQLIDQLEKKKYVKRVRSTQDRRVVFIELASKGHKVVKANEQHVKHVGLNIMQKFNAKEQARFLEFFQRMAQS